MIIRSINEIDYEPTSHGSGRKYVLAKNINSQTNLTQVALGELNNNDVIEMHNHPTMEEFYYFLEGEAIFCIKNNEIFCEQGTFVQIPCNTEHKLTTDSKTKFIYWGIAI